MSQGTTNSEVDLSRQWQEFVLNSGEPPWPKDTNRRLAGNLSAAASSLWRSILGRCQNQLPELVLRRIRREYGHYQLWCDGYGVLSGELDNVLAGSKRLRLSTYRLLVDPLAPVKAPGLWTRARELSSIAICEVQEGDDSDSDTCSNIDPLEVNSSSTIESFVEDLATSIQCLVDLSPCFDEPVLDETLDEMLVLPSDAVWDPAPHLAAGISQRYQSADDNYAGILGLENWERLQRPHQTRVGNLQQLEQVMLKRGEPGSAVASKNHNSGIGTSIASSATGSTTASNDTGDAQKPQRARTSKPKVKTGCNNCKQRRIKCDEKRPSCVNCIRSKRICSGYPPSPWSARPIKEVQIAMFALPPRRIQQYQQRNTLPSITSPPATVGWLHKPSTTLPFDSQEGLYFQLFQEQTASSLSGFFDSAFWTRLVLQECHSEGSIRHTVVALGALYKTLERSTESPLGSLTEEQDPADGASRHWEMAVKQYSRACQEPICALSDSRSYRTRLMANMLLACFNSFIGDYRQAIVYIQTGLRLLEQLRTERRRAFLPRPEEPVEAELVQMLTRLAIQAKLYDIAFHFPQPWVVRLTAPSNQGQYPSPPVSDASSPISVSKDPIPDRFSSVMEARVAWDKLCERIFRFTETMSAYAQNGVMGVLPTSLLHYGVSFKTDIKAWSLAFDHILASRTASGLSSQEKACIAVLKMYQIMSYILFLVTFSSSEMDIDKYTADFNVIVDLALEVVGNEERRAALNRCPDPRLCHHRGRHDLGASFEGLNFTVRHIMPSFSADLGIVPPLFFVATKCRNHDTRWKAIQLLKSSPRREGMWDSELTARIAVLIADIEESGDPVISLDGVFATNIQNAGRPSPGRPASPAPSASTGTSLRTSQQKTIPEERRVIVRAAEFDLRKRTAVVQLGSRGLLAGTLDLKTRVTRITW
ncbi:Zn(2)-C6 fungal-type domain-containing protein [Madurella fahalii]|uniref:Zn(2)-C6 fungal-type domain-containing protein n=1 Tax=Madurella fahalii TaxID=1157608 RepID=A0ABQ0GQH1_9PEZI